jgi:hypothetical protein
LTKQRFASYNDTENFDRATFFYIIDDDAGNFEKATFNPNSMTLEVLTNLTYKQPLFGGGAATPWASPSPRHTIFLLCFLGPPPC